MIKCVFNLGLDLKSYLKRNFKLLVIVNSLLAISFVLGLILGFNADAISAYESSGTEFFKYLKGEQNALIASVFWLTFLSFALVVISKFNAVTCKISIAVGCAYLVYCAYHTAGVLTVFGIKAVLPLLLVTVLQFAATLALEILYLFNISDGKTFGCGFNIEGYAIVCGVTFLACCIVRVLECIALFLLKCIT